MKIINFFKQHKIQGIIYILLTIGGITEIMDGYNPLYVLISVVVMIYCVYSVFNSKFFVKKYIECPNCKNKLDKKQTICNYCGFNIINSSEPIKIKRELKKNNILIAVGFYIMIMPIILIFMFWLLTAILFICFGATSTELKKYFDIAYVFKFTLHPIALIIEALGFIVMFTGFIKKIKEKS